MKMLSHIFLMRSFWWLLWALPILASQDGTCIVEDAQQCSWCDHDGTDDNKEMVADRFATAYLDRYYPSADTMTSSIFPGMCPRALERALAHLIKLFDREPWRYFFDDPSPFDGRCLWPTLSEFSKIVTFVEHGHVDACTGCVYSTASEFSSDRPLLRHPYDISLIEALTQPEMMSDTGFCTAYDLFALYFDYLLVYFNHYVFRILLSKDDLSSAAGILAILDRVIAQLLSTPYEATYQAALVRSHRIYSLLVPRATMVTQPDQEP